MTGESANRWITLAANVGVLIGLILLIVEIRHAIDLSESEAYRNRGTEIQAAYQELALSPDLAAIGVKAEDLGVSSLSRTEFVRWSAWIRAAALRMQNQFNDHQLGYLDDASYEAMMRTAARSYTGWQPLGIDPDEFDPKFVNAIETIRLPQLKTSNGDQSIFAPKALSGADGE